MRGITTCNWLKRCVFNSAYGALGSQFFRFFDLRQAIAITTSGQLSIRWIENRLNGYMNKILKTEDEDYVIASDTDSIYLSLDRLVNKTIVAENPSASTESIIKFMDSVCEVKLKPFINKSFVELAGYVNAYDQKMIMKREGLSDKGIWTAKKRYILRVHNNEGVQYAKPKIKVMGLEVKKSSTPTFFKDKMGKCIEIIMDGDESLLLQYISDVERGMKETKVEEISFPRGVNGLSKFADSKMIYGKGCPIHVRGSLLYNHQLQQTKLDKKYPTIKEGEKIKYVYLKEPNKIHSNVIAFSNELPSELDLHSYVDHDTMFEKAFIEPIKIITDAIGWKTKQCSSLESFFS